MYKKIHPGCIFVFQGNFNAYTSEEDESQDDKPLVNESGQNIFLEYEYEYDFLIRKSRDRSRQIYKWVQSLINFCKNEELLIMNGRLKENFGMGDFMRYSGFIPSLINYILCSLSL